MITQITLSARQHDLLRRSFGTIARDYQEMTLLFFDKLFELDPSLRLLLGRDIEEHRRKFAHSLALVIRMLDEPALLHDYLQELSQRYRRLGIEDQDYKAFGAALQWAVSQSLQGGFTPEAAGAWRALSDLAEAEMTSRQFA